MSAWIYEGWDGWLFLTGGSNSIGARSTIDMVKKLAEALSAEAPVAPALDAAPAAPAVIDAGNLGRSREQPTTAKLLGRRLLNGPGSQKETWHIDLDLAESGIDHEVGDSFGIFAKNDLGLVDQIIAMGPRNAIIFGTALSLSSTAIAIPVLAERRRLNTGAGRTAFSILLFQDLMVAPLLFTVSILGVQHLHAGAEPIISDLLWTIAPAFIALASLLLLGRLVLRPLFHLVAAARSTELFMAACLFVIVATSVATAVAGLSMALGAFVAGLLLAETEFRREIEVTIEPFQGLLLGLFFVWIGTGLDLSQVAAAPGLILAFVIGVIVIKAAIIYLLARGFRLSSRLAGEVALVLAPGGEFAFVMIGAAIAGRVVPAPLGGEVMAHDHDHARVDSRRALAIALALTAGFTVVEVVGGIAAGSLAVLADAVHM